MPPAKTPNLRLRREVVRAAMQRRSITSYDALAVHIGVSGSTIERGLAGKPSARLIAALCVHLELPLNALVETVDSGVAA